MKIEYDPEADALYIQIREAHPNDNIDIEEGVTVDVDENGHIVGVEILDASKRLNPNELSKHHDRKAPPRDPPPGKRRRIVCRQLAHPVLVGLLAWSATAGSRSIA